MGLGAQGTIIQVGDAAAPEKFTNLAEVTGFSGPSLSRETIDVTTLESTWRTYLPALADAGEVTLDLQYDPDEATHGTLVTLHGSGVVTTFHLHWPDYATAVVVTVVVVTNVWTSAAAHGWATGQPVRLTTTDTLPPPIVAGTTYYARAIAADTFTLHLTSADAVANANIIDVAAGEAGVHSAWRGARWPFEAIVTGIEPSGAVGDKETARVTLKVTGSITPA